MIPIQDPELRKCIDEVIELWDEAEKLIKIGELSTGGVSIPPVNELRYSGRHILRGITGSDPEQLKLAKRHALRAKFDAVEVIVLTYLDHIQKFDEDFRSVSITDNLPGWTEIKKRVEKAKNVLCNIKGTDREEYFRAFAELSDELTDDVRTIDAARDDLVKKLKAARWKLIGFIITLVIAGFGTLYAGLSYHSSDNCPPPIKCDKTP